MGDPFLMIVAIVLISSVAGLLFRWMNLRYGSTMDSDMEDDFFRMRDEIDRLNARVAELERH